MSIEYDKEHMLSIHIKPKNGKKDSNHDTNAKVCISYYRSADYGSLKRSLEHKGYSETFVLTRKVTIDERDSEIPIESYRIKYSAYSDWNDLINDEKKFVVPSDWIEKLEDLKKKYPQIKKQKDV
jgi:hypothetical protein